MTDHIAQSNGWAVVVNGAQSVAMRVTSGDSIGTTRPVEWLETEAEVIARMAALGAEYEPEPEAPEPDPEQVATRLASEREKAQAAMLAQINAFLARFTDGVPVEEVASWATKAAAARAHLDGHPSAMIEAEAALTGETADALAETIVARSEKYTAVIARVTGLRRATNAAIAAADTEAAIWGTIEAARIEAKAMAQSFGLDFP